MTINRMLRILEREKGSGWHLDIREPVLHRLVVDLLDPISLCFPRDPVAMPDGFLYDRKTLERLRNADGTVVSPVTRQEMRMPEACAFEKKMATQILCLVLKHFRLS